jgi:hypothetical protein
VPTASVAAVHAAARRVEVATWNCGSVGAGARGVVFEE